MKRRAAILHAFVLAFVILSPLAKGQVKAVGAISITVSDLDRAVDFYSNVLSFRVVDRSENLGDDIERLTGVFGAHTRTAMLTLGREEVTLVQFLTPQGRPVPLGSRSNDRWFQHIAIVVSDMDAAYQLLRSHGAQHVSTSPQRIPDWNRAAAGIRAFYFQDPDRHNLEIIWFPPGKGDPRWQEPSDSLFLGIDHTAIAVAETSASLTFYRDVLGFRVGGESRNHGIEQSRLNLVEDASLLITGLRANRGPGVEFLEYLQPRDGQAYPADSRSSDGWHWETTLEIDSFDSIVARLQETHVRMVSRDVVVQGGHRSLVVRDPDGHALRLVEAGGAR